ncbi:nucleotide-binding protein [Actinokineospora sp. NBRC 105648]|uniref:nucleotide-binding protein n=1 Tax=Actinokineospora sp. NBRC 105648 TaxID=3032206 RepID=UPI0025558136|nr:nucleotide-binding protein [Actinokineospora sp. NBRC 105648]
MTAQQLEEQFLSPYRDGAVITVNGKSVSVNAIERLRVSRSDVSAQVIMREIELEDARSSVLLLSGPSLEWRAAGRATDVTDEYVVGPPGGLAEPAPSSRPDARSPGRDAGPDDRKRVFLIHGRDRKTAVAMKAFLRALGLRIVEWDHAVSRTGTPNPYVGDVVGEGLSMADAAVVLLTPDEIVVLREDLQNDDDGPVERTAQGQGRPNVYYEAGIADALGRQRTVLVEVGRVKRFSDVAGRLIVRFDGSPGKRKTLTERLKSAGLDVDTSGSDWLNDGNFAEGIEESAQMLEKYTLGDQT